MPPQATPSSELSQADLEALTQRTQEGGTEVVQAKAGKVRLSAPVAAPFVRVKAGHSWWRWFCGSIPLQIHQEPHSGVATTHSSVQHGMCLPTQRPCTSPAMLKVARSCCEPAAMSMLQGSATLSMAYAGALFADACLRGLNGDSNVVEPTFVESKITELPFFASKVRLGPSGEAAQHRQPGLLHSQTLRTYMVQQYTL